MSGEHDRESQPVRPSGTRNLRTCGPLVLHFHGRVESVLGTARREAPSLRPLAAAATLLVIGLVLPDILALLPVIVLVLLLVGWLRWKGWLRGSSWLRRVKGPSSDAGLQVVTFRVQICSDDGRSPFALITCRLVQKADAVAAGPARGDIVTGRGHRVSRHLLDVSRLEIGAGGAVTLLAVTPRSAAPIRVVACLVAAVAAVLIGRQWDLVQSVRWEGVLFPVLSAVFPLMVLYVIVKKVVLRR